MRSKQSSKELGEIARMTETCLFSDRLCCDSLSVSAVLLVQLSDQCKCPHSSAGVAFRAQKFPFAFSAASKRERERAECS